LRTRSCPSGTGRLLKLSMGHGDILGKEHEFLVAADPRQHPVWHGIQSASDGTFEVIEGLALGKVRESRSPAAREPNQYYVSLGSCVCQRFDSNCGAPQAKPRSTQSRTARL